MSAWLALAIAALATTSCARPIAPQAAARSGEVQPALRSTWRSQSGTCMEIPEWEVHELDRDLYILRQSPCTSYEKPFVFLVFGEARALLLDTGAGKDNHLA